jgi:hypothetical protein
MKIGCKSSSFSKGLQLRRTLLQPAKHSGRNFRNIAAANPVLEVSLDVLRGYVGYTALSWIWRKLQVSAGRGPKGWTPLGSREQYVERPNSVSGHDITPMTIDEREAEAKKLPRISRYVTLEHGTERPFTGQARISLFHIIFCIRQT